jgi:hypothetical protein
MDRLSTGLTRGEAGEGESGHSTLARGKASPCLGRAYRHAGAVWEVPAAGRYGPPGNGPRRPCRPLIIGKRLRCSR